MARKEIKFSMRLGCLADPIEEQLNEQGLTLGENVKHSQALADCISHLYVQELLTEAEAGRARTRLCKRIAKHIRPLPEVNDD